MTDVERALTIDDARFWMMRESGHYNGGKEWFGYRYTCVEQPRISRFDKYARSSRSVESTWRLDGRDVCDLEAAIAGLANPPIVDRKEWEAINKIGRGGWCDIRAELDRDFELIRALADKGLIRMDRGHGRLTDLGRDLACGQNPLP